MPDDDDLGTPTTTTSLSFSAPSPPFFQMSPAVAGFVAGTIGGIAGVVSGHPFDTIKVRLQTQPTGPTPLYRGTWHCFTTILRKEGLYGLFRGMASPLFGVAAGNALLFGVYGGALDYVSNGNPSSASLTHVYIAGTLSGSMNALISGPMELVKIRLQNQTERKSLSSRFVRFTNLPPPTSPTSTITYSGPLDCAFKIIKSRGWRGLCLGLGTTVMRDTPSYGIYFVTYEVLCRLLAPPGTDPKELGGIRLVLAGGFGGIAAWASTYPIDVAKTLIQSQPELTPAEKRYKGTMDACRYLVRTDGYRALFRGFVATVVRAFPTNVAILGTWHVSMKYFRMLGWVQA